MNKTPKRPIYCTINIYMRINVAIFRSLIYKMVTVKLSKMGHFLNKLITILFEAKRMYYKIKCSVQITSSSRQIYV